MEQEIVSKVVSTKKALPQTTVARLERDSGGIRTHDLRSPINQPLITLLRKGVCIFVCTAKIITTNLSCK